MAAVALVVQRCPARKLMAIYKVPSFEGPEGLLQHVAAARGRLLPGGVPDMEVSLHVLLCSGAGQILSDAATCSSRRMAGCLMSRGQRECHLSIKP